MQNRTELEALNLNGPYWRTPEVFDDELVFEAVCERELEGVVAKCADSRFRTAATVQANTAGSKPRTATTGYELERASAISKRRARMFV